MTIPLKKSYIILLLTIILFIIGNGLMVQSTLKQQNADATVIDLTNKQGLRMQKIVQHILYANHLSTNTENRTPIHNLSEELIQLKTTQDYLEKNSKNSKDINALLNKMQTPLAAFITTADSYSPLQQTANSSNKTTSLVKEQNNYLELIDTAVIQLQDEAQTKLHKAKIYSLLLSGIAFVLLLGEFFYLILPGMRKNTKQNLKLSIANEKLSDFTYIITHNLKSPINNLMSLLGFYAESDSEEDKKELIDKIDMVTQQMDYTMKDLVAILQIQHTHKAIKKEVLNIEEVFVKAKEKLHEKITACNAEIKYNFEKVATINYPKVYCSYLFKIIFY